MLCILRKALPIDQTGHVTVGLFSLMVFLTVVLCFTLSYNVFWASSQHHTSLLVASNRIHRIEALHHLLHR